MKTGLAPVESQRVVYTVSDFTRDVKFLLEDSFPSVWIEGEIGNFKRHSSGHFYFCLKDAEAQVQCVMFRRENASLNFEPEEGLKVLAFGRVSVYPARGQYQLYVERLEPKGLGALQLRFEQMKERLKNEGLFDEANKKEIPYLPRTIGVVTSTDGAAIRDILNVLGRRFAGAHVRIMPVPVQGNGAAAEIAAAIDDLNRWRAADVMILARGGGSLEDLWAFNEEIVARAIFRSEIPVISAIGHETDFTIADFVADLRAPTPSAAAELVMPPQEELALRVLELKQRSLAAVAAQLKFFRQSLGALAAARVLKNPLAMFEARFQRLDELKKDVSSLFKNFTRERRERVAALAAQLEALGPLSALRRGFSVTLKLPEGRLVKDARRLKRGDKVKTRVANGYFLSEVTETHTEGENR